MYEYCSDARQAFRPSKILSLLCLNIVEPRMRECFARREPLCWVKVCQTSDEILEVRVMG